MNKRTSFSVHTALAASVAAIAAIIALGVAIPFLSRFYLEGLALSKEQYLVRYTAVLVCSYLGLLPVLAADALLIKLLRLVGRAEVFTSHAVNLLQKIALCCVIELFPVGALFFLMGHYGILMIPLAFVAILLAAVLYVLKNVIECAAELKAENDFTV